MFVVVCAWCAKENVLNVLDYDVHGKDAISHGICGKHLEELKAEVLHLDGVLSDGNNADRRQHSPAVMG